MSVSSSHIKHDTTHSQRRSSTRGFVGIPLPGVGCKNPFQSDYDLSKKVLELRIRQSSSAVELSNILPRLSVGSRNEVGHPVGKKVVFVLDKTDADKGYKDAGFLNRYMSLSRMITRESIKYGLEHKEDQSIASFNSILTTLWAAPSEGDVEPRSMGPSDLSVVEPDVFYSGRLKHTAAPVLGRLDHADTVRPYEGKTRRASRASNTPLSPMDVWPFPWLDFEARVGSLYKSGVPGLTFAKQGSLPKLPIPDLANSLKQVLESLEPVTRPAEFKQIKKAAEEFENGAGKLCQKILLELTDSDKHWIKSALPNYGRLYSRHETPILSTGIVAPFIFDLWPPKKDSQIERAAILIDLALEFWLLIRKETLRPVTDSRGNQICMHQFRKLFSAARIPGKPCDATFALFHTVSDHEETPKHIVVIYRGQIFTIDVVDSHNVPIRQLTIQANLEHIVYSVDGGFVEMGPGVGSLTSQNRDDWSCTRFKLMQTDENNRECLMVIEEAMFVLSLDAVVSYNTDLLPHEAIFGDGCNRWYDKSLNFYIYKNGVVTINANTSLVDGSMLAILLHYMHLRILEDTEKWDDDVIQSISKTTLASRDPSGTFEEWFTLSKSKKGSDTSDIVTSNRVSLSPKRWGSLDAMSFPRQLQFTIEPDVLESIELAQVNFSNLAASVEIATCKFEEYEADIFSKKDINTDAFAHMAIHLAFFTMYFRIASIGSRVSLKRFYHGRYEIMSTTTNEMAQWVRAIRDPKADAEARKDKFWKAEKKHRELLKENCSGQGCHNHMTALRVIAQDNMPDTPRLFQDDCIHWGERFEVYSASLGVGCTSCVAVLPNSTKGYGIGYFVANTKIMYSVSSWKEESSKSARLFAFTLNNALSFLKEFIYSL